eukprot:s3784_g2.t1
MSEEELMEKGKFLRPAIIGKTRTSGDSNMATELYNITLKEATEKQWLCGPLTYQQVGEVCGQRWLPVRRFGVEQKDKLRPIDGFCENQLNSTFTTVDKISLRAMDHVTWAALIICKHCMHAGEMRFVLKTGEVLSGPVHDDWRGNCELKVTALDLKSAYKQLPLHESDVPKAVIAIMDPSCGETKYFTMRTLPFGAAASVLHFNRISRLLWALGCKLGLIWASYYDDYPLLCPSNLEASSLGGAKALFNLLGFEYAGDKMFDPAPKADILGVELDLSLSGQGCVDIRNKQDRIEDICKALDNILETGRLKPRDLPSHLGRLQFAEMQIAGRAGKLAMHDLRQMGSTGAAEIDLEPSHVSALKLLRKRIASGKPRRLEARPQTKPWILFTTMTMARLQPALEPYLFLLTGRRDTLDARWELPDLNPLEAERLHGDSALILKMAALYEEMEANAPQPGVNGFLMEHPEDSGEYLSEDESKDLPSVWEWPELRAFAEKFWPQNGGV